MPRRWGPGIAAVQDALAQRMRDFRDSVADELPAPLHGDNFEVVGSVNRDAKTLLPTGIRVFPPANTSVEAEVSEALEGAFGFPCIITVRDLAAADVAEVLREAQGIVLDGVQEDPMLADTCAGFGSPAFDIGPIDVDGLEATQEIVVRLVLRL